MNFVAEFGFDIRQGKVREFQEWLSGAESKLAAACPAGVEYVGTYAAIYSSEKHAGAFRQFFRLESYGSQDALAAAGKEGGDFRDVLNAMNEFVDQDRAANWSNGLFKKVTEATIWDEA